MKKTIVESVGKSKVNMVPFLWQSIDSSVGAIGSEPLLSQSLADYSLPIVSVSNLFVTGSSFTY